MRLSSRDRSRNGRRARARRRGYILPIVLLVLVPILALAVHIASPHGGDTRLATISRGTARVEAIADGAVFETAFHLSEAGRKTPADLRTRQYRTLGATVTVCMVNEAGKINPNRVNAGLLAALLQASGMPPSDAAGLADAIHDWRAATANGFADIRQLRLVRGVTPALLDQLEPDLTVLTDGDIDPLAAPPLVARALTSLLGHDPALNATPVPLRTVSMEVEAVMDGGFRFVREAAVQLPSAPGEVPRVLTWRRGDLKRCRNGV